MNIRLWMLPLMIMGLILTGCSENNPLSPLENDPEIQENRKLAKKSLKPGMKKIPFVAKEIITRMDAGARFWVMGDILHMRKQKWYGSLHSEEGPEISGSITDVMNYNINLKTGRGTGNGKFTLIGTNGKFHGTMTFKIKVKVMKNPADHLFELVSSVYVTSGKIVGHGSGEYEGMLVKAETAQEGPDEPYKLEGYVQITKK